MIGIVIIIIFFVFSCLPVGRDWFLDPVVLWELHPAPIDAPGQGREGPATGPHGAGWDGDH